MSAHTLRLKTTVAQVWCNQRTIFIFTNEMSHVCGKAVICLILWWIRIFWLGIFGACLIVFQHSCFLFVRQLLHVCTEFLSPR